MIVGAYWNKNSNNESEEKKIEKNIELAKEYAIKLWNEGFAILTPHLNTRDFEMKTNIPQLSYRKFYLDMLKFMNFIFVLPNWDKSNGVKREIKEEVIQGIPIFDNIVKLKEWANIENQFSKIALEEYTLIKWSSILPLKI